MEHGLVAPGGVVQAGLNFGYQTADVFECRGQGPPPQLWPVHGPGIPNYTPPTSQSIICPKLFSSSTHKTEDYDIINYIYYYDFQL